MPRLSAHRIWAGSGFRGLSRAAVLSLGVAGPATAGGPADHPAVDGVLQDWSAVPVLATDPAGDSAGPIDLRSLRAQSRGTRLFIQFDVNTPLNLSSGPTGQTTLTMRVIRGARSITVDFRNRRAYLDGNSGTTVSWPSIGFSELPTTADTRFEMELDMAAIGAAVGESLQIVFAGADSFTAPAAFTLVDGAVIPGRRSAVRPDCATLRVVSFNTFFSGLADAQRRSSFIRLIDSVDADVYCFQEEYDTTLAQVQSAIAEADPLDDGATWSILKVGELEIASRFPLTGVTLGSAYQGAIVHQPGGVSTLVMNNHMKCCGYAGNSDDAQRVSQASAAVGNFNAFRAGNLGPALQPFRNVPAVLVGDWNLVGSTTPLDLWLASPGPSFTRAVVRHLIGDEGWTWSSPGGTGFWPGILDLGVYDASRMRLLQSFSLNSAELNTDELLALGLQGGDSLASDHLMLVLDFQVGKSADVNQDGAVNTLDLTQLLVSFGQAAPPDTAAAVSDINSDGTVNTADLVLLLASFGRTCP